MGYFVCVVGVGEVGGELGLYEAWKACRGIHAYVVHKAPRERARCVMFYCGERGKVVPMHGALPREAAEVEAF